MLIATRPPTHCRSVQLPGVAGPSGDDSARLQLLRGAGILNSGLLMVLLDQIKLRHTHNLHNWAC